MTLLALVVSEIFKNHFVTVAADFDDSVKRKTLSRFAEHFAMTAATITFT